MLTESFPSETRYGPWEPTDKYLIAVYLEPLTFQSHGLISLDELKCFSEALFK